MNQFPKVLIVGRGTWTKNESTLSNIFQNYNHDALSYIYIETLKPDTDCCNLFFQISEFSLIKRIFNKKVITGKKIQIENGNRIDIDKNIAKKEQNVMRFIRAHRSIFFSFMREILWSLNTWKTKELNQFIDEVNPDVVFVVGNHLLLMYRLHNYVINKAKKPVCILMMDDFYTYKSTYGFFNKIYRYFVRVQVRKLIKKCSSYFVISNKMKSEYDQIFKINSKLLTKGIDFEKIKFDPKKAELPIKMVYMGKMIYGRYYSLRNLVKSLKELNKDEIKAQLYIYTSDRVTDKQKKELEILNISFLMPPIPYSEVKDEIKKYDVVVFVESLLKQYKNFARLSFSTKLVDYIASSRAIFAIGINDVAPIEYLKENDMAFVAVTKNEIETQLKRMVENIELICKYSEKAFNCGQNNHNLKKFNHEVLNTFLELTR